MTVVERSEPWTSLLDDDRVVFQTAQHGRRARTVPLPDTLHPDLLGALRRSGIERLYCHQAQALIAAWAGPMIACTGTASGKSLCFNLPALDVLCRDPKARTLYLYPTKALAQDQARALNAFGLTQRVRPAIYDGDTPREARAQIRKRANVILTNPDMLHLGILPNHRAWAELFCNLAVIVIDEAHVYRGVFGSHVANVIRRLRRIAAAYGTEPRILLASATIANPAQLAEWLTGQEDHTVVDDDGSPNRGRRVAMWNPPIADEALGTRRSALPEAAEMIVKLVSAGARTICFARSRKAVEVIHNLASEALPDDLALQIAPYRAGYTPLQRREIEGRLARGELRAVITTDALELGIDVGSLDAAIVVSFPGTVASLRQMWGRAGRRERGLGIYLAGDDALDQFFCRHPEEFLDRPIESAILDHESEEIHQSQLLCAAHEGPIDPRSDTEFFGPRLLAHLERLVGRGELRMRGENFVLRMPERYPAAELSLRSAAPGSVAIVDTSTGEMIGGADVARAHSTLHEQAIYLHLGRQYRVQALDLEAGEALVEPFNGDWYTQPKSQSDTLIERLLDRRETLGVTLSLGRVSVSEQVLAFQRRRNGSQEVIDIRALEMPSTSFATRSLWYELDHAVLAGFPVDLLLGSLHAVEHAQIAVLPLLAMCDRWDIGGLSTNAHRQTGSPTIFIHDAHPGGVGIARVAFDAFETLVANAHRLICECPCESGCPSCVQSPKCGNLNEPLHKAGAQELLERMLARGL